MNSVFENHWYYVDIRFRWIKIETCFGRLLVHCWGAALSTNNKSMFAPWIKLETCFGYAAALLGCSHQVFIMKISSEHVCPSTILYAGIRSSWNLCCVWIRTDMGFLVCIFCIPKLADSVPSWVNPILCQERPAQVAQGFGPREVFRWTSPLNCKGNA